MKNDFGTDAPPITVTSGYRSYDYQKYLFETAVQRYEEKGYSRAKAETLAARYTAGAGESEHQSGLCVDIHDRPCATVDFENSPHFLWLLRKRSSLRIYPPLPEGQGKHNKNRF